MRSATSRNYWGGFLGGVLGILAFAWLPPLLPLGCFLGVVSGFWYQEIYVNACSTYETGLRWLQGRCPLIAAAFIAGVLRAAGVARGAVELACASTKLLRRIVVTAGRWLACVAQQSLVCMLGVPAWLRTHPMNQAYMLRGVAALVFTVWSFYWLTWLAPIPRQPHGLQGFLEFCLWGGLVAALSLFCACTIDGGPASFYRTWERYARRGAICFWLSEIVMLVRLQLVGTIVVAVAMTVMFSVIPGLVLIFLFAVSICVGRGIYQVAQRPDHWPCFAVTLLVTTVAALVTRPYLAGVALWLVALTTGCVAGAASEATRRLLSAFLFRWPQVREFLYTSIEAQVGRAFTAVGRRVEPFLDRAGVWLFAA
ncbi:hypothetical protein HY442_00130 [Candidatus Parcubacteria bacterium]|nr:hypothetical protein [Candidatus Parcubacteria bacterium]MBI4385641.1 hypothetical protein [Candidatus Parcubacteria bacterium]